MTHPHGLIQSSSDFRKLEEILQRELVGLPVLRMTTDPGTALHLGEPKRYQTRKLAGMTQGTAQVRVWRALREFKCGPVDVSSCSPEWATFDRYLSFVGDGVASFEIDPVNGFTLRFNTGARLSALSSPRDNPIDEEMWHVMLPDHIGYFVYGGTTPHWELRRTDVPLSNRQAKSNQ